MAFGDFSFHVICHTVPKLKFSANEMKFIWFGLLALSLKIVGSNLTPGEPGEGGLIFRTPKDGCEVPPGNKGWRGPCNGMRWRSVGGPEWRRRPQRSFVASCSFCIYSAGCSVPSALTRGCAYVWSWSWWAECKKGISLYHDTCDNKDPIDHWEAGGPLHSLVCSSRMRC